GNRPQSAARNRWQSSSSAVFQGWGFVVASAEVLEHLADGGIARQAAEHDAHAGRGPSVGGLAEVEDAAEPVARLLAREVVDPAGHQLDTVEVLHTLLEPEEQGELRAGALIERQVTAEGDRLA